jgi:hypothetical protein
MIKKKFDYIYAERLKRIKFTNINALIQFSLSMVVQNIVIDHYKKKFRTIPCYALKNFIVIDDIGDVFACEPLERKGFIGNIRKSPLNEILLSKKANYLKAQISKKCCVCTWENAFQQSLVLTPQYYLRLALTFIRIVLAKII